MPPSETKTVAHEAICEELERTHKMEASNLIDRYAFVVREGTSLATYHERCPLLARCLPITCRGGTINCDAK